MPRSAKVSGKLSMRLPTIAVAYSSFNAPAGAESRLDFSTKLLRDQGAGPTILVSPLLSLMRNQIEAASRIGIRALTINSSNHADWDAAEAALARNACDILLISPERLGNDRFMKSVLPALSTRVGLLVVVEVHCISDWGMTSGRTTGE